MRVYRDIPFSIRALCVVIGPIMHMPCFCVWQRTAVFFCMAYFARFLFVASYGRTAAFMGIPLLVQLFNRLPFSAVFPLFHALWRLIAGVSLHSGNHVFAQVLSIACIHPHTFVYAYVYVFMRALAPSFFRSRKIFENFLNIHLCVRELPLFMRLRATSIFLFLEKFILYKIRILPNILYLFSLCGLFCRIYAFPFPWIS